MAEKVIIRSTGEGVAPFELNEAVQGLLKSSSVRRIDRTAAAFVGLADLHFLQKWDTITSSSQVQSASILLKEHKSAWLAAASEKNRRRLTDYAADGLRQFAKLVPHQVEYCDSLPELLARVLKVVTLTEAKNAQWRLGIAKKKRKDPVAFKAWDRGRNAGRSVERRKKDPEAFRLKKRLMSACNAGGHCVLTTGQSAVL